MEDKERAELTWLHAKMDRGMAQWEAGDVVDGEEFCSQLRLEMDRRIAEEGEDED